MTPVIDSFRLLEMPTLLQDWNWSGLLDQMGVGSSLGVCLIKYRTSTQKFCFLNHLNWEKLGALRWRFRKTVKQVIIEF